MDSQRRSIRNNLYIFQGQFQMMGTDKTFIQGLLPTCISNILYSKIVYIFLKLGTLYIYSSKRNYLNNPEKPDTFYNLNTTKLLLKKSAKNEKEHIQVDGITNTIKIYSNENEQLIKLMEVLQYNKQQLCPKIVFPKRFSQMDFRITQQKKYENGEIIH